MGRRSKDSRHSRCVQCDGYIACVVIKDGRKVADPCGHEFKGTIVRSRGTPRHWTGEDAERRSKVVTSS